MADEREILIKEIDTFLKKAKMSPTRFAVDALNDRAFMVRLRNGCNIGVDKLTDAREFMRKWKPPAKAYPKAKPPRARVR